MLLILEHWLDNGRGCVRSSIQHVHNISGYKDNHTLRGVDWCHAVEKSLRFGDQLKQALLTSHHPLLIMLRNYEMFDIDDTVFMQKTLTWRIKRLNEILETEERILKLELENLELRKAMNITTDLASWKVEALQLLANGHKQQDVAAIVGKSLATIKRRLILMHLILTKF